MPSEIYFLKVGMNMTEGIIEEWYVADGETVQEGEMLYRLETEKVNMDVDAEHTGTVKHAAQAGVTLEPGDVIGFIYAAGEEIPATLPQGAPAAVDTMTPNAAGEDNVVALESARVERAPGERILSSPAALRGSSTSTSQRFAAQDPAVG